MDKLRVGGPAYCLMSDDRVAIAHIWEGPQEVHAVFGDGSRGYHSIDNFTPAPFIPGDVVEHRDRPGLRELVDDAGKIGIRTHGQDGETRFYCYSSVAAEKHGKGYTADLTLILPAQPAKEADHG